MDTEDKTEYRRQCLVEDAYRQFTERIVCYILTKFSEKGAWDESIAVSDQQ
jgi:hypothetical protein